MDELFVGEGGAFDVDGVGVGQCGGGVGFGAGVFVLGFLVGLVVGVLFDDGFALDLEGRKMLEAVGVEFAVGECIT